MLIIKSNLLQFWGEECFYNKGTLQAISSKLNFLFHKVRLESKNKAKKIHSYSLYNYSLRFTEDQNDGSHVSFLDFS